MTVDFKLDLRRVVLYLLCVFFSVVLELVLQKLFGLWSYLPSLIPVLIVFLSFYRRSPDALFLVTITGLIADFAIADLLGPRVISAVIIYLIFQKISANLFLHSKLVVFAANAVASLIYILNIKFIYYLMLDHSFQMEWVELLVEALMTGIVAVFIFFFLRKLFLAKRTI